MRSYASAREYCACPMCHAEPPAACKAIGLAEERGYRWKVHDARRLLYALATTERCKQVANEVLAGAVLIDVAHEYGISAERISQLVQRYCAERNAEVYNLLAEDAKAERGYSEFRRAVVPLRRLRKHKESFCDSIHKAI